MVSAFADRIYCDQWERFPSRVAIGTQKILDMLDEYGVKATFFVLGWVGERHPDLVRNIHVRGHEIACHSYCHRLVYDMTPQEFKADTRRARRILEDCIGKPVLGYRAPSYSITQKSMWALDILAEEGFKYDSSIFPIYHDCYGYPGFSTRVVSIRSSPGRQIVEVPLSVCRIIFFDLPVGGGGYLRLYPSCLTEWAVRRINACEKRPIVLYVHPWELDPDQPRLEGRVLSRIRHYVNIEDTSRKLAMLLGRFEFYSMGSYLTAEGWLS